MRPWQIMELCILLAPGFLILWRVRFCRRPTGAPGAWSPPSFSVIVPARNEAHRLPLLLESLRNQTLMPAEVLVVDDASTDGTAAVAAEAGCRVISPGDKPPGWLGKTWACWVGASNAAAPLLLFLDADTRLDPAGCERILQERQVQGGVITVQPWHHAPRWTEKLSSFFNVIVMAAINTFTAFGQRLTPGGCFGPCILCARNEYFRIDGHRAVRGSILEDLDLGRGFLDAGIPVRCRAGKGTINFRMYPEGIRELVDGWSKNMAGGARGAHPLVLLLIALWISGCASAAFFAVWWILSGNTTAAIEGAGFYLLYAGQLLWMYRRIGSFGPQSALLFPVHLAFFMFVFLRSLVLTFLVKRVSWKGRIIRIQSPGSPPQPRDLERRP